MIKRLNYLIKGLISLLIIGTLASCNKEDEGPFEFQDQLLQGKIGGVDFMMKDGRLEEDLEEGDWFIEIYGEENEATDACNAVLATNNYILFGVPLEVGLYKLNQGQLVLLNDVEGIPNFASEGAIEILTVSETEVTGRLDAQFNNQNFVNGNFSVGYCDPI